MTPQPTVQKRKVVVLAAMGSETKPLEQHLPNAKVVGTGVGKVLAAATTSQVIWQERPDALVFVGVAGALNPKLRQLDVVVAQDVVQWDVDITALNGGSPGTLNNGERFLQMDARASHLALEAAQALGFPAVLGRVATGDAFVADATKTRWIAETFGADAVEMEGAAAAQIAQLHGVPMVLIRVISDAGDGEAALSFNDFLEAAAERAALVVAHFLPAWQ